MTNPLYVLTPALSMLKSQIEVLEASGGAVEDLELPDEDEREDLLLNQGNEDITEYAENPTPSAITHYRPTPPLFREEKQLYHFFVDGSRRTYYLATGIEENRAFPIELAQIGATAIHRDTLGRVRTLGINHQLLLLLPKGPLGVSDTTWRMLSQLDTSNGLFKIVDTSIETQVIKGKAALDNLRARAQGLASHEMHLMEIETIKLTDNFRDMDHWLILDGGVKWDKFLDVQYMIGVAKNFRKNPRFVLANTRKAKPLDITKVLSNLPYAHRTPAFSTNASHSHRIAFWYIRLRERHQVNHPLQGVVKVELPLIEPYPFPVDAELVDLISRTLVAERNVTPYGRDQRWHCHLYPIFQAEQAIKTRFYSQQVIKGMIRWPRTIEQEIAIHEQ